MDNFERADKEAALQVLLRRKERARQANAITVERHVVRDGIRVSVSEPAEPIGQDLDEAIDTLKNEVADR